MKPKYMRFDNDVLNQTKYDAAFGFGEGFNYNILQFGLVKSEGKFVYEIIDDEKFSLFMLEYPELIEELIY